jgi:threonine synthase
MRTQGFLTARIDDPTMLAEMVRLKQASGYVACPHSSIGFAAARITGLIVETTTTKTEAVAAAAAAVAAAVPIGGGGASSVEEEQNPSKSSSSSSSSSGNNSLSPCVVMATASPCKFQESVTVGLGKGGWAEYRASPMFPASAAGILAKAEVCPTAFDAADDKTLTENQAVWESKMRAIIMKFAEN